MMSVDGSNPKLYNLCTFSMNSIEALVVKWHTRNVEDVISQGVGVRVSPSAQSYNRRVVAGSHKNGCREA